MRRVLVDGEVRATQAPQAVTLELAPGAHELRVEKAGFEPWTRRVTLAPGERQEVAILLRVEGPAPARAGHAALPPALRIAAYDPQANGLADEKIGRLVAEATLAELRKLERVSTVGMSEIREMLSFEQSRQLLGCGEDACLTEIGGALGVDELLNTSLSVLGDSSLLTVRRVDMRRATINGTASRRMKTGNGEEFLAVLGDVLAELYPEYPLRPGRTRGVAKAFLARLDPPPLAPVVTLVTGSGAALALATGVVFGLLSASAEGRFQAALTRAHTETVSMAELRGYSDEASARSSSANLALGIGALLVAATAVEALFTDWQGAGEGAGGDGGPFVGPGPVTVRF